MNSVDLEKMLIEIYSALDVVVDTMVKNGLITETEFRQLKQKAEEEEAKEFYDTICGNYLRKLNFIKCKLPETTDKGTER